MMNTILLILTLSCCFYIVFIEKCVPISNKKLVVVFEKRNVYCMHVLTSASWYMFYSGLG